jgi:hypothetical protein
VHKGERVDQKFLDDMIDEGIKNEYKIGDLTPLDPSQLPSHIRLIKKLILLDVAGSLLSGGQKKIIERGLF